MDTTNLSSTYYEESQKNLAQHSLQDCPSLRVPARNRRLGVCGRSILTESRGKEPITRIRPDPIPYNHAREIITNALPAVN
jgi:hypothetical protein